MLRFEEVDVSQQLLLRLLPLETYHHTFCVVDAEVLYLHAHKRHPRKLFISFCLFQLLCSTVQKALFEEEERVSTLSQQVRSLEKANSHLREKVKNMKRQLRQSQRVATKEQQTLSLKQLYEPKTSQTHPDQETSQDQKNPPQKKVLSKRLQK